ncbi:MAG: DNA polymerase III subunit delta [Candidatus Saccharimonadales bacterium]
MIVTLAGDNDVLRGQELKRLTSEFVTEHTDIALERLDGEEVSFERIHEAVQAVPFLSSQKMVVLRSPGANKEFTEKFETIIGDVAESSNVILVEPKLDKRLAYYKALKKLTEFREFTTLDANGLTHFLVDYAASQGGSLNSTDARFIIERVGQNQLTLQHEIDKLLNYNTKIDCPSIELLTESAPQSSIFELLDAAFAGNSKRALELYSEQRTLRQEPQKIIAMIIWQLYILALVKTAGKRSADDIAHEAKLSPFTVRKTQGLARNISLAQLKKMVSELRQFDVRLKSEALIADEVVRYYLLSLNS